MDTVTDKLMECVEELRGQERFYEELYNKYQRESYFAMSTAYKIAARIVERAMEG